MASCPSSGVRCAAVLLLLIAIVSSFDASLQCFVCRSPLECRAATSQHACSADVVNKTAQRLHFMRLPRNRKPVASVKFACVTYKATWPNGSDVQVSGCLYDTYNACVNVNRVAALTYMCRYCDTADGCNGDVQSASGRQMMVTLVLSSVAAVLAVMPLI